MPEQDAEMESVTPSLEFHSITIKEVLEVLNVDPNIGLSNKEVEERLEKYGPNTIPKVKGSIWKIYIAPILNWLITIYLISSFSLLIIPVFLPTDENQAAQATVWLAVVAINALVAIFQQFRAQKKLEALEKLSAGEARVIREGAETKIDPSNIVPGDIVKLEQGDRIPADARIVTESNLSTNEASLTGESIPTDKDPKIKVPSDAALVDRRNMVFFGTYVATGTSRVVATETGIGTEIGKIQGELEQLNTGDIPLRKKVNRLAKYLGIAAILLMVFSFMWQLMRGDIDAAFASALTSLITFIWVVFISLAITIVVAIIVRRQSESSNSDSNSKTESETSDTIDEEVLEPVSKDITDRRTTRLKKIIKLMIILTILMPLFLFLRGLIVFADEPVDALMDSITQAMTIMPINIPLLTTIVLLTGVLAMARKGVIIRDLSAVESLGRVSVICSDKTGTMTRNQMTVKFCWDTENLYRVTGAGYEPVGEIFRLKEGYVIDDGTIGNEVQVSDVFAWKGLYQLVTCGGIDNDSEIVRKEIPDQGVVWVPLGDPTDAALLTLFRKSNLDEENIRKKHTVLKEFPFESDLKRMSKVCKDGKKLIVFAKGATEVLLPKCTKIDGSKKPKELTTEDTERIQSLTSGFAAKGYRVISLAYKNIKTLPSGDNARDDVESDLIYLGFVCIVDPPREGVKKAVNACHSAGISVVMITGDAAATAKTIASDLNILRPNTLVHEGGNIESISDEDFPNVHVYARVNPEHKQVIVERYQAQQKVVAMTGDGVNDALALAMSDAGIAMGITGTDVAKEAADIVITDDSFASIVTGVHQGRGLFQKIRMMIYFYVAINLFESIVFFGALFVLPFSILSTWQALYLVVTTHSFPGLALVFDKISPRAMEDKPRDSEEIITRPLAVYMIINVILMTIGAVLLYFLTLTEWNNIIQVVPENLTGYFPNEAPFEDGISIQAAKASVMMLSVILIIESSLVLIIRRINIPLHESLKEPGTNRFSLLIGLICLAHILLMYIPDVQAMLHSLTLSFYFIPLTIYDWMMCFIFSLPAILGMELYKYILRKRDATL
jgi:magnesium-transporting ATPase (P-type)